MTARELLKQAISLMHETDTSVYEDFALAHVNLVLAETFDVNNRIREYGGKEPLDQIPLLESFADELPYEDGLTRLALPFGLLTRIFADEGNNPMLGMYKQEYATAVNSCDRNVLTISSLRVEGGGPAGAGGWI